MLHIDDVELQYGICYQYQTRKLTRCSSRVPRLQSLTCPSSEAEKRCAFVTDSAVMARLCCLNVLTSLCPKAFFGIFHTYHWVGLGEKKWAWTENIHLVVVSHDDRPEGVRAANVVGVIWALHTCRS